MQDYVRVGRVFLQGWKDGPVVKSTGCSFRGSGSITYTHKTAVTSVSGAPTFMGMAYMWCTVIHTGKTLIHLK